MCRAQICDLASVIKCDHDPASCDLWYPHVPLVLLYPWKKKSDQLHKFEES
jgi:hypothetical protein